MAIWKYWKFGKMRQNSIQKPKSPQWGFWGFWGNWGFVLFWDKIGQMGLFLKYGNILRGNANKIFFPTVFWGGWSGVGVGVAATVNFCTAAVVRTKNPLSFWLKNFFGWVKYAKRHLQAVF